MTQVKRMQQNHTQVALRSGRAAHSLAARRAEFEARVREMATDDLKQVGKRLKDLREELERKSGQPWRIQDVAEKAKIPLRTYAAWEGGENEARGGEGYKILARFYTRRLRREVTWRWIVFGEECDQTPAKAKSPLDALSGPASAAEVGRLESELAELRGEFSEMRDDLQRVLSLLQRGGRDEEEPGGN